MFELTPALFYSLTAVAVMLLVGFPVHEYLHAYAAYRLGDSTARWQGRLTLDPRVHFDPIGGTLLIVSALFASGFFLGFAKPTPVNPMNLRGGRHGEALVAAAGPLSNLVIAVLVAIPLRLVYGSEDLLLTAFETPFLAIVINISIYVVLINISLFVFNLLPVPPLDGWRVLLGLVSPRLSYQLRGIEQQYAAVIPFLFLGIILVGGRFIIGPLVDGALDIVLGSRTFLDPGRALVLDWWGGKVRQAGTYLRAGVPLAEREALAAWLTPAQLRCFDAMHVADQRHGLDVVSTLRAAGHDDPELLLAGLLHDAGKGDDTGLLVRVSWSLGERYGPWVWRLGGMIHGLRRGHVRMRDHAERSAELALMAGCTPGTAALIREQARPTGAPGRALLLADEAC